MQTIAECAFKGKGVLKLKNIVMRCTDERGV